VEVLAVKQKRFSVEQIVAVLKQVVADLSLDKAMLQDAPAKKF
jgi:hypothetical protein